ncbi:hypothetical protein [Streptomyces sp. NPDC010273]|uniref:hypothetical protein n=1 Tax=Streptomyces sp. NPDC010273 TaxID=3364829 RepID=UPI0036E9DF06
MLFPTLGDALPPDDARTVLTSALSALTWIDEPAEVATMLLENQGQWELAHWELVDGVRTNDGNHSFRNPANTFALPEGRLREISGALHDGEASDHLTSG